MATLVLDPPPFEFQALLERRKRLDQDRHDEIWEGVYHMAPAPYDGHAEIQQQIAELLGPLARRAGLRPLLSGEFNIGAPDDFRVPDGGILRERTPATWHPTAALAVEIVSPGDETWAKLPFYAAHRVEELLILDPAQRSVAWFALAAGAGGSAARTGEYLPVERSGLIELSVAELAARIDWPPTAGA